MPIFVGRLVGGSTTVNGGTCFRTPPWVLDRWCEQLGTDELSREAMAPYFERVEAILGVAPAAQPQIGANRRDHRARLRRARLASLRDPAQRAATATGHGFCDFGCRTDAQRATNVSYIPSRSSAARCCSPALRIDRVIVEGGRAVGVEGTAKNGQRCRVRAAPSCSRAARSRRRSCCSSRASRTRADRSAATCRCIRRPASPACSTTIIDPSNDIPQGYGCDEFLREGQLIAAAQPTPNVAAQIFQLAGRRLMDVLDRLDHVASIGLCVRDATPNGRVWRSVGGRPVITYSVTRDDRDCLHSGMVRMFELLFAAGARRLYAGRSTMPVIEPSELARFRASPPSASELALASYHPLGTCRMGRDPATSVVGLDHQTHDVRGLYIVDGSTVPGAPGVNPQLTIMAMATRAADKIADAM